MKRVTDEDDGSGGAYFAPLFVTVVPENEFLDGKEQEETEKNEEKGSLDHVTSANLSESLNGFGHEIEKCDGKEGSSGKREKRVRALDGPETSLEKCESGEKGDDARSEACEDDEEKGHR